MGLLVGEITPDSVAHVAGVHILTRSDKRKDRCEISAMQLAGASAEAERLTSITGREVRIIGWYHSHPHITVLPSHVDVRTQGAWQMMDEAFVGLIFSVFNEEANKTQRIQMIAFQSVEIPEASSQTFTQRDVPIKIVQYGWPQTLLGVRSPHMLSSLTHILFEEEKTMADLAEQQATNPLEQMHGTSIHHKFLSKFLEYNVLPLRQYFASTRASCAQQLIGIAQQKAQLQQELDSLKQQVEQRRLAAAAMVTEQADQAVLAAAAAETDTSALPPLPDFAEQFQQMSTANQSHILAPETFRGDAPQLPAVPQVPAPANQTVDQAGVPQVPVGWTPPSPKAKPAIGAPAVAPAIGSPLPSYQQSTAPGRAGMPASTVTAPAPAAPPPAIGIPAPPSAHSVGAPPAPSIGAPPAPAAPSGGKPA